MCSGSSLVPRLPRFFGGYTKESGKSWEAWGRGYSGSPTAVTHTYFKQVNYHTSIELLQIHRYNCTCKGPPVFQWLSCKCPWVLTQHTVLSPIYMYMYIHPAHWTNLCGGGVFNTLQSLREVLRGQTVGEKLCLQWEQAGSTHEQKISKQLLTNVGNTCIVRCWMGRVQEYTYTKCSVQQL